MDCLSRMVAISSIIIIIIIIIIITTTTITNIISTRTVAVQILKAPRGLDM